ncbi:MAG TPA: hypothetical protein HPP97_16075 [Desulfuromonadales bacterium]|nr:hypothetical protein [Desulfuromonadales bacterium]
MKSTFKRFALLTASLMIFAVPVLADEGMYNPVTEPEQQQGGKDQCLLVARNCSGSMDSIQERINRIQGELNKGSTVYSNDELRRLQNSLDEEKRFLNNIEMGG